MAMDFRTTPFPGPLTMEPELPYAGFWRRTLAWLIDALLLFAAWVVSLFVIAFIGGLAGASDAAIGDATGWPLAIGLLAAFWLYSTLMEASRRQATIGKLGAGIVVTDLEGRRISWGSRQSPLLEQADLRPALIDWLRDRRLNGAKTGVA